MAKVRLKSKSKLHIFISVVLIIGMLISLFLLYEHFTPNASAFCNFGEGFDCGIVNKSPYANIDGIFYLLVIDYGMSMPMVHISDTNWFLDLVTANAFWGFLTLVFMFFLVNAIYKKQDFLFIQKEVTRNWARGIAVFGVLYGLYLFYVQHSILKTYCVYCLALDAVLLTTLISVWCIRK